MERSNLLLLVVSRALQSINIRQSDYGDALATLKHADSELASSN